MSDARERAARAFPVRPLPRINDRRVTTTAAQPLAQFGPYEEGDWVVISIDVDCRAIGSPEAAALGVGANPPSVAAPSPMLQAGVHDFTVPAGCRYVWISTVTQPPPASHEIACWAVAGDVEDRS